MATNAFLTALIQLRQNTSTWFAQTPAVELIEPLVDTPPVILKQFQASVLKLPVPDPYQQSIREALTEAIQEWQLDPELENNSLVVLGRSVEDLAPILKASLQAGEAGMPDCEVRFFLGGYQRPASVLEIPQHLRRELEPKPDEGKEQKGGISQNAGCINAAPVTQADLEEQALPVVMVVPSLEQCFLRCIQGWEGIEYLQAMATQDTSKFWVFGCNHWAWAFLERVCKISAYLERTVALPKLSGEALQAWLEPLQETELETVVGDDESRPQLTVELGPETHWNSLSSTASGIASTAAQLWLQALKLKAICMTEEGVLADELEQVELLCSKPTHPSLMSLEVMDRYMLHSLLIHREMTRSQLALSLGEAERTIRSRLQVLRREGIIRQRGRRFSVHPAHYPKIYSELSNNNFLVGEA